MGPQLRLMDVIFGLRRGPVMMWTSLAALTAACGATSELSTPGSSRTSATQTTVDGDAAVWVLGPDQSIDRSSTTFTALVSRLECNNGVTGDVLAPEIHVRESDSSLLSASLRVSLVVLIVHATRKSPTRSISGSRCWIGHSLMASVYPAGSGNHLLLRA